MRSVDFSRLLYLSLWRHLLLGVGKLLRQPRRQRQHRGLLLLGVGFGRNFLLLIRVLQAILGKVGNLRGKEEVSYSGQLETRTTA